MAEQVKAATVTELEQLKLRQDALLNKIGSLQSRLNKVQRERNIPYDISNVSIPTFKELQEKQSSIFERLLNIASKIDKIASKQNIELPAKDEVSFVIERMAKNIEKRQERTLTQLKVLTGIANSIQSMQITPQIKKLLIDDNEEKKRDFAFENNDKSETDKFKSRLYDLELVSECLRAQCQKIDNNSNGKISKEQLIKTLDKISLIDIDGSVKNEKHIQKIINELTFDTIIDYNKFIDLIIDFNDNNKMKSQWNLFRYNLIGKGRIEGKLRIFYRYDGWPEPLQIIIKNIDTKKKNNLSLKTVLKYIENNTKDIVEFDELRYASKLTFTFLYNILALIL